MNKKILIASSNKGKIKEFKEMFKGYEVIPLKEAEELLGKKLVVEEEQNTFKDNALEKVRGLYNQVGEEFICIADDSGISIDVLDGFPGVHTARWMDADDHIKNLHLLEKMKGVKKEDRTCNYTTVIALKGKGIEEIFEHKLYGFVSDEVRGHNGFGFDEIFELENDLTLAEIPAKEKYEMSPRKLDLDDMLEFFKKNNI